MTELSDSGRAAVEEYERAIDGMSDAMDVTAQTLADFVMDQAESLGGSVEAMFMWLLQMQGLLTQWHERIDTLCTALAEDGVPGRARAQHEAARYFAADQAVKNAMVMYMLSTAGAIPAPTISEEHGWELPLSAGSVSPFKPVSP